MYMTDTFCSFMRNVTFKSCFLLSEYGSIYSMSQLLYMIQERVLLLDKNTLGCPAEGP